MHIARRAQFVGVSPPGAERHHFTLPVVRMPEPVPPDPGDVDLARVKRVDMAYPPGDVVATVTFHSRAEPRRVYGRAALALVEAVREYNRQPRSGLAGGGE